MRKATRLTLTVNTSFKASHSLAGFETPHVHLWKIEAMFESAVPFTTNRLIDLVFLKTTLDELLEPIHGKFLNEAFSFQPTSENLVQWIWDQLARELPDSPLCGVAVTLCDLEGNASGTARLAS